MKKSSSRINDGNTENHFKVITLTCLLVGTLDIIAAIIDSYVRFRTSPVVLLQFIASGIFGRAAFSGGLTMAFAGLIFHFFIASCWTLLFFSLYPKLKISSSYKVTSGIVYGIIIWCIMNLIVVPLSDTPKLTFHWGHAIMGALYLISLIGLPISLIYHRYYQKGEQKSEK